MDKKENAKLPHNPDSENKIGEGKKSNPSSQTRSERAKGVAAMKKQFKGAQERKICSRIHKTNQQNHGLKH